VLSTQEDDKSNIKDNHFLP